MDTRYFFITTKHPKIVRCFEGQTEVYKAESDWTIQDAWYDRIFFSDFDDYEEVSEKEANIFIKTLDNTHKLANHGYNYAEGN